MVSGMFSTRCIVFNWLCYRTSRLSILCTVIRITSTPCMRRFLHICAYLFGISWIILFAQVFWVCVPEQTWKNMPTPQCLLGNDVAVAQSISTLQSAESIFCNGLTIILAFIGTDVILVYAPVQLIWNVRLPQGAKIRLIVIFAATILTTVASLYYIYAMLRINGITEEFAATIHVCQLSLFISQNVTYFTILSRMELA